MKITPFYADAIDALLCEDGSTVHLDRLAELVVIDLKGHGHFGNVAHHISRGDWTAVHNALREVLMLPQAAETLSPLARNLVTLLGARTRNLRPFRPWLLERVEGQTTELYRRSLERRVDALAEQLGRFEFRFSKSAFRIIATHG